MMPDRRNRYIGDPLLRGRGKAARSLFNMAMKETWMKKLILLAALGFLAACETDQGGGPGYASYDQALYISADRGAGRLGTLRGYVIRRSGSPLCRDPIVEARQIRCSNVEITGPTYEIAVGGTLSDFVVEDSQNRDVCFNPQVSFVRDQAFIDC